MKKIFVYILVGILSFSVVFSNYYKSAHAMEWVSGALSFAETLTWVLASLGITCTVSDYSTEVDKTRAEFWESYEQDFYNYVNEHEGNTSSDRFIAWKNKLCEGVLDKSSEYWDLFKSWANSLIVSSSGGGSVSAPVAFNIPLNSTISDSILYINNYFGLNTTIPTNDYYSKQVFNIAIRQYSNGTIECFSFYSNNQLDSIGDVKCTSTSITPAGNSQIYFLLYYYNPANNNWSINRQYLVANSTIPFKDYISYFSENIDTSLFTGTYSFIIFGDSTVSNFDSVTSNVNDLDVISSDGVDEDNPEVTLPYPGVSDSDDTISSDIYQDIIDAINDGTITQEEGVERIHEILKVITYDTITDKVIPPQKDPDTGEDKTKDEVIKENKENMGFTLAGLENVFPFCIPFDIYAFMTLLVAEPEAPEVDFPIQSINGEVEEIHIDLSPFDSVAVVVRYIFDFLFIIGLGILTRSLIGGGSSD